jgi:hypothetical protein
MALDPAPDKPEIEVLKDRVATLEAKVAAIEESVKQAEELAKKFLSKTGFKLKIG